MPTTATAPVGSIQLEIRYFRLFKSNESRLRPAQSRDGGPKQTCHRPGSLLSWCSHKRGVSQGGMRTPGPKIGPADRLGVAVGWVSLRASRLATRDQKRWKKHKPQTATYHRLIIRCWGIGRNWQRALSEDSSRSSWE
jgi:hypothetical protein